MATKISTCYGFYGKSILLFWTVFLMAILGASRLSAEPEASLTDLANLSLEELLNYEVTAATKTETRLTDTPGSVSVITYAQIRSSGATTIPELLRQVPGMHVRWNQMVQTVQARGFGSNPFTSSVLLLIDGIPYNSWNKGGFPQHPGADFFNLENVKHIEVIRGAGSALYGENALNGVINIVTLSGREYRQTRLSVKGGNQSNASASVSYGNKVGEDGAVFLSVRAEKSRLPVEFWEENDADNTGQDLFLKAQYKGLQLSYYRRQDEFDGFRENIVPPDFDFASVENVEQTVDIVAAKISHSSADKLWGIQANLSYANRKGTACGGCHAASQSEQFQDSIDHGSQLFGNGQVSFNGLKKHQIMFGTELRKLSAGDAFNAVETPDTASRQTSYKKQAYFVQDRFSINKDTQLYAGVRYDAATEPVLFDSRWFPRLALVAKATEKLTLRAGWSEAARYPTFTELYQNTLFFGAENSSGDFAFPPTSFQANPNLKPETVSSFEVGVEYRVDKSFSIKLDLFHNTHEDPIVLTYGTGLLGFENHGNEALVRGSEVELRFQPSTKYSSYINWSYQLNSQTGNNLDSAGLPIEFSYAPTHKLNGGATLNLSESLAATLEFSWRDKTLAPQFWSNLVFGDNASQELGSYALLNAKTQYRLPFKNRLGSEPFKLSMTVKNLTDQRPIETLTGVSSQLTGRSFLLQLDYEWVQ